MIEHGVVGVIIRISGGAKPGGDPCLVPSTKVYITVTTRSS
jgi:hypothetical protein